MSATHGWILSGVRTPFVKAGSAFRRVPSYELGRIAASEAIARAELDPARLDEVVFGHCAMPAEAANSSRIVALRAGVPERVPAFTVHRNCASGMEAVASALYRIHAGDAKLILGENPLINQDLTDVSLGLWIAGRVHRNSMIPGSVPAPGGKNTRTDAAIRSFTAEDCSREPSALRDAHPASAPGPLRGCGRCWDQNWPFVFPPG